MPKLIPGKAYLVDYGRFTFIGTYSHTEATLYVFKYIENTGYGAWDHSTFKAEASQIFTLLTSIPYEYW